MPVKLTCVTLHRRACGFGYSEPCVDNPLLITRHLLINVGGRYDRRG
jgi:hypothetical protein